MLLMSDAQRELMIFPTDDVSVSYKHKTLTTENIVFKQHFVIEKLLLEHCFY